MPLIDALLQKPAGNDEPVVACDMEGTLSAGVTWKGMRNYLHAHGRRHDFNRFFRSRILQIPLFRLGLIDRREFRERWMVDILALFAGLSQNEFAKASRWVVENELWPRRRRQVIDRLLNHQKAGHRVVVVSGLIEPMLSLFVAKIDVEAIGTPVLYLGKIFSGRTAAPFTTGQRKIEQLQPFLDQEGKLAAAYGDTAADIPMLALSRFPTAVYPDKKLRQHAQRVGWSIIDG